MWGECLLCEIPLGDVKTPFSPFVLYLTLGFLEGISKASKSYTTPSKSEV